ncbi:oligosaccharide flippase family protein [Pontiellaceae bacterium B12219]|nr:oligosaccharide flippase family protein [Pontiellaceae bacterium B12219]
MDDRSKPHALDADGGGFFSRESMSSIPWMVVGKLALFFIYIGISIITVDGLGREKYGVYSLLMNLSQYMLMLCGMGLGVALMRYIPELAARRNRFGLVHLLWKSAALQLSAVVIVSTLLLIYAEPLQRLFKAEEVENFRFYLFLACVITSVLLMKDFVGTAFTSLYKTRVVALLSVSQGVVWIGLLYVWLLVRPAVATALTVQIVSVAVIYTLGSILLVQHVRNLPWEVKEFGIGKKRALVFSGTVMLSSLLRIVMFKYSEIFFLAAIAGTTVAGMYDLGYTLPYTAITFLPLAFLPIFTAAFAEAYVRDKTCLGRLIKSYYKLLMLVSLPVAVLGAYFSPIAYRLIYRGEMDEAGQIASALCIVLLLPLVSMPLSAAIKAKEKVLNMMPMLVLQLVVNLFLDWLLIVHFRLGMYGGILAVVGTFVFTIPIRLWVVSRIIGGVYFPALFCLRITVVLAALAGSFYWISQKAALFTWVESRLLNLVFLAGIGGFYLCAFLLMVRYLRLVRKEDVQDFQALDIARLNSVLRFLVKS